MLTVRVSPKSSRAGLGGLVASPRGGLALAIRLAAPAVEGAANQALVEFLARRLSLRKADLSIVSGRASRVKTIRIVGDPAAIVAALETAVKS
jgi:uncharacterized protein (TIGR00251 family)